MPNIMFASPVVLEVLMHADTHTKALKVLCFISKETCWDEECSLGVENIGSSGYSGCIQWVVVRKVMKSWYLFALMHPLWYLYLCQDFDCAIFRDSGIAAK